MALLRDADECYRSIIALCSSAYSTQLPLVSMRKAPHHLRLNSTIWESPHSLHRPLALPKVRSTPSVIYTNARKRFCQDAEVASLDARNSRFDRRLLLSYRWREPSWVVLRAMVRINRRLEIADEVFFQFVQTLGLVPHDS